MYDASKLLTQQAECSGLHLSVIQQLQRKAVWAIRKLLFQKRKRTGDVDQWQSAPGFKPEYQEKKIFLKQH